MRRLSTIDYMLAATHGAPAHARPPAMEALIRHGSDRDSVLQAFAATPEETDRLDELLARPGVWEHA